jgi:hypothetical protein
MDGGSGMCQASTYFSVLTMKAGTGLPLSARPHHQHTLLMVIIGNSTITMSGRHMHEQRGAKGRKNTQDRIIIKKRKGHDSSM